MGTSFPTRAPHRPGQCEGGQAFNEPAASKTAWRTQLRSVGLPVDQGQDREPVLAANDVDQPQLNAVHVVGDVHDAELQTVHSACIVYRTPLEALGLFDSVVEAGLNAFQAPVGEVYKAILPASDAARDSVYEAGLQPGEVAGQMVYETDIEPGHVRVLSVQKVHPDSGDRSPFVKDLHRIEECDLDWFVLSRDGARRDALELLKRPWFSGGTVAFVSSRHAVHRMKDGAEAFEDGTPHFQAMLAVADGVHSFRKIGAARIGRWTRHLTERALTRMNRMRRKDGGEAVEFYGPRNAVDRGATIPFNLLVDGGTAMSYDDVVAAASARRIHLRGGCFCNPGASEIALRFPVKESLRCMETMAHGPFSPQLFSECMGGHAVGAIRASFGLATTEADVDRFCDLLEELVAG